MNDKAPRFSPEDSPNLVVEDTDRDLDFWANRPELSEELRRSIRAADVVIVPEGDDFEGRGPYFPEGTMNFFHFLKEENVSVEVAASNDDFRELARHFDLYMLGEFVVTNVIAPLFVGRLMHYWENRSLNPEKSVLKIGFTIRNADGSSQHLSYEGPLQEFETQIKPILERLADGPTLRTTPPVEPPELPPSPENPESAR